MIAKLMEKNGVYYCSECRMRQFKPSYNCVFCGNLFSNATSVFIEKYEEQNTDEIKGVMNGKQNSRLDWKTN